MLTIAILGLGVVGSGTADLLTENKELIAARLGQQVRIKYILDIRDLPESPYHHLIVHDIAPILADPEVDVVVEVIGGSHPAFEFDMQALCAGKHVVTSNKEIVANFGDQLLAAAAEHGVRFLFEASVGGGIPVLRPLSVDLMANDITEISGILNGTTNYILTRMYRGGVSFDCALQEAKEKGYAEANPAADVEGLDACRKIAILTALACGVLVPTDRIHTEGITAIRTADVKAATAANAAIKLLGRMLRTESGEMYVMVAPFVVPTSCPVAHVEDVFNGILVSGNCVGDVMFYGRGAGALPTASAVVSDVLNAATAPKATAPVWTKAADTLPSDFSRFACRRYVAIAGADETAARVLFGDIEPLAGEETAFLTPSMSEQEFADCCKRLTAVGGELLSHIRVYE